MTTLPFLDVRDVETAVSMLDAVRALQSALRAERLPQQPRSVVEVAAGQLLLMPAQSASAVGVKVVSVAPGNHARGQERIQGVYVLFDAQTLAPVALLDGVALTSLRTAAVSAVSAARLAVEGASELVVFGSGPQAWGHVLAMRAVRPVRRVRVVARDPDRTAALVDRVRGLGLEAAAAGAEAVADADIVCTCTSSRLPLFDGALLPGSVHVVAVGSHEPTAREVDTETVRRAWVVVEDRGTALREAGDLAIPLREGAVGQAHLRADLPELVAAATIDADRLTLFKSVGMAWEDLAVATLVHARWRAGQ
jgi:ornithine cyclodeaminase/alanine dehydrogenase-like protein (mu-crystallin family)